MIESGQTPFFCFYDGFCKYFDTRQRLTQHYAKNPSHNIPPAELNKLRQKSLQIQEKRRKANEVKNAVVTTVADVTKTSSFYRSSSVASSRSSDVKYYRRSKSPRPRYPQVNAENTNFWGSITVRLTSCLYCLDSAALLMFN